MDGIGVYVCELLNSLCSELGLTEGEAGELEVLSREMCDGTVADFVGGEAELCERGRVGSGEPGSHASVAESVLGEVEPPQLRRCPVGKAQRHAVVDEAGLQVQLLEAGEAREGGEGGVVEAFAVGALVEQVQRG